MYEWSENQTIQRSLYSGQLDKLPILSPESVKKIKYDFLPDDLRSFIEGTNTLSESKHLSTIITPVNTSGQIVEPQTNNHPEEEKKSEASSKGKVLERIVSMPEQSETEGEGELSPVMVQKEDAVAQEGDGGVVETEATVDVAVDDVKLNQEEMGEYM